jgi:cytochrome c peroxidase
MRTTNSPALSLPAFLVAALAAGGALLNLGRAAGAEPRPKPAPGVVARVQTVTLAPTPRRGAFFASLGTNGRSCNTCHVEDAGWSITPAGVRRAFEESRGSAPLFRRVDGAVRPDAPVGTQAERRAAYALLLEKGLIRVGLAMPAGAEFDLDEVEDPYGYATAGELSLFRRPLPSTNLRFNTHVMWDGRHSPAGRSMADNLAAQAIDATLGHAQAARAPSAAQVADMVRFESALHTAQVEDAAAGRLDRDGALGGPARLLREPFAPGINSPLAPGFDPAVFKLFTAWQRNQKRDSARAAIARGEQIFATRAIVLTAVGGINDVTGLPAVTATCGSCHNAPNAGGNSIGSMLDLGLSNASRRTPDQPLYTFRNRATGETRALTDPGRGLVTGRWQDLGKFKVPVLRALAARAPYFHDGSAADLAAVVEFYDTRFGMALTAAEKQDLVAFLRAL